MYQFIEDIEVKSIPEQIADQFKHQIMTGKLKPGDRLPSLEKLTEGLGVSKPTVREALHLLNESGLVRIVKGRNGGYFVTEFYPDKLTKSMYEMISISLTFKKFKREDLLEIRKMVEIPCAALAAIRRTEQHLVELNKIKKQIEEGRDLNTKELLQLDLQFHLSIANCTRNPLLNTVINAMTRSYLESINIWNDENKLTIIENSAEVIEAIMDGDEISAEKEMEKHLNHFLHFQTT